MASAAATAATAATAAAVAPAGQWVAPSVARLKAAAAAAVAAKGPQYDVVCSEAVAWLEKQADGSLPSVFASIPDAAEMVTDKKLRFNREAYCDWFVATARLMFRKTHPDAFVGMFATDRNWYTTKTRISKFGMYWEAAKAEGWDMAWHKIVPASPAQRGRPTFSHFVVFVRGSDGRVFGGVGDIVDAGAKSWPNATPAGPVSMFMDLLVDGQANRGVPSGVVDLFAGVGTIARAAQARRPMFEGIITAVELDDERCDEIERALEPATAAPVAALLQ